MRESAVPFGGDRFLGVLTEPSVESRDRPCLVILNAGLIHRVGPGRLSVEIARRAAAAGFSAFRFDLSGLGDSAPRMPPLGVAESAVVDVREALEVLGSAYSYRRFVLLGLCSGAIHAHYAVSAHEQVVGAVFLDGYAFSTLRFRLNLAADLLRSPVRLIRGVVHRVARLGAGSALPRDVGGDDAFPPRWPPRRRVGADLEVMRARGVQLLLVYSGEWHRVYRYEGQMRAAFPSVGLGPTLTERLIAGAEHLYFTQRERQQLLDTLATWLTERFPATGRANRSLEAIGLA